MFDCLTLTPYRWKRSLERRRLKVGKYERCQSLKDRQAGKTMEKAEWKVVEMYIVTARIIEVGQVYNSVSGTKLMCSPCYAKMLGYMAGFFIIRNVCDTEYPEKQHWGKLKRGELGFLTQDFYSYCVRDSRVCGDDESVSERQQSGRSTNDSLI